MHKGMQSHPGTDLCAAAASSATAPAGCRGPGKGKEAALLLCAPLLSVAGKGEGKSWSEGGEEDWRRAGALLLRKVVRMH